MFAFALAVLAGWSAIVGAANNAEHPDYRPSGAYAVDVVFAGHYHIFESSLPLDANDELAAPASWPSAVAHGLLLSVVGFAALALAFLLYESIVRARRGR